MKHNFIKNNSDDNQLEEYMSNITLNCDKNKIIFKNPKKINEDTIIIPNISNYEIIYKYKYNVSQLKIIAKTHKLKITGNKSELINRIYTYLYLSSFIIKIQKIIRGIMVRKYKMLHGPAALNRKLCTNTDDFITMEPIENINFHQFLSYKDDDGFIYGFDIISLHNLILKSKVNDSIKNPYNRNIIPESLIKTIRSIIRLSSILKIHINLHYEDENQSISNEKIVELRILALFQSIDALGNYSDPQWFNSLNRNQLIKFVRELCDIWNYRSQITLETKHNICPPNGDPFRHLSMPYIHTESNMYNVKKVIVEVLEKLVNSGIDNDSKSLGAYYVLGALTIVNETAAASLPWLFQSFGYF
jgi:hypothetical protein